MCNITLEEFGRRLKDIRESLGITQCELAEKTGVYQATISIVESGKSASFKVLIPMLCYYSQYIYLNYLFSENFQILKIDNIQKPNIGSVIKTLLEEGMTVFNKELEDANKNLQQYIEQAKNLVSEV